jgi:ABC-type lipoprotein export system ATPase subunit
VSSGLLEVRDLVVRYGERVVVDGVDLELGAGDKVALVGRSGSGKTSLLLAIAGLLDPARGTVDRGGLGPVGVAIVFQSPSLIPELSAAENVALPLRLTGALGATDAAIRAKATLAALGIDAPDALPGQLSGGQQQRVAVARVLATGARLILADEPTGALDHDSGRQVLAALHAHCDEVDGALLVATHDEAIARDLPVQWSMTDGRLSELVR